MIKGLITVDKALVEAYEKVGYKVYLEQKENVLMIKDDNPEVIKNIKRKDYVNLSVLKRIHSYKKKHHIQGDGLDDPEIQRLLKRMK